METSADTRDLEQQLEQHRSELTAYCYRMLGSPFEAEDAVQETLLRAWRGFDRFEGRASLRSWLYRIATNVCLDMLNGRERRARPMDLGPAREPVDANLGTLARGDLDRAGARRARPRAGRRPGRGRRRARDDPARVRRGAPAPAAAAARGADPLRGAALEGGEVAELLETSVASVNSALQRARAHARRDRRQRAGRRATELDEADRELLARYVDGVRGATTSTR